MGNLLVFSENDMLGHVTHVDTEQIIIEIENSNLMNKICVGNLVAIETSKQHENLIALIDKVTRKYMETYMDEDNEIDEMMASSTDYIKVSVIGTYYSVYGSVHDLFKRGVETFPQIESKCYEIIGQNLQNFMNILGKDIDTDKYQRQDEAETKYPLIPPASVRDKSGQREEERIPQAGLPHRPHRRAFQ